MLKKVALVVVALFSIVSVVPASTITFSNNGATINAVAGSTVDLFITSDVALISMDAYVNLTGDGSLSSATNKSSASTYGWDAGLSFDPIFTDSNKKVEIALGNFSTAPAGTIAKVSLVYNGGKVVIDLSPAIAQGGSMDADFGTPGVLGQVTVVPEPMTMGLLGLGGLFLARHKK